jgi:hypothetical protein
VNATPQFCYEKLCVAVTTRVSRTCLVSVAFPTSCDFVRLFRYTCWQSKCTFLGWLFLYSIAYTHPPHPPPHIIIVKLQFHWSSQRGHCHSQLSSFLLFWIQPVLCTFSGLSQEWQTLHVLYTKSGSDKLYMFSGPNQEVTNSTCSLDRIRSDKLYMLSGPNQEVANPAGLAHIYARNVLSLLPLICSPPTKFEVQISLKHPFLVTRTAAEMLSLSITGLRH